MIYSNKKGDRKEKGYRKAEKRGVLRGKMKQSRNNMGGERKIGNKWRKLSEANKFSKVIVVREKKCFTEKWSRDKTIVLKGLRNMIQKDKGCTR